jgi:hypothetical protein
MYSIIFRCCHTTTVAIRKQYYISVCVSVVSVCESVSVGTHECTFSLAYSAHNVFVTYCTVICGL